MDLYDWLLFLHVLGAFFAVGALTALWALILGTRGTAPPSLRSAMAYGGGGLPGRIRAGLA